MRCRCSDNEGSCGLNNVEDRRCCFYCEFKASCEGFCTELDEKGDKEEVVNKCDYSIE